MGPIKVELNEKEFELVKLIHQHRVLELGTRVNRKLDYSIDLGDLTCFLFSHPTWEEIGVKRIVYCLLLKSLGGDRSNKDESPVTQVRIYTYAIYDSKWVESITDTRVSFEKYLQYVRNGSQLNPGGCLNKKYLKLVIEMEVTKKDH